MADRLGCGTGRSEIFNFLRAGVWLSPSSECFRPTSAMVFGRFAHKQEGGEKPGGELDVGAVAMEMQGTEVTSQQIPICDAMSDFSASDGWSN